MMLAKTDYSITCDALNKTLEVFAKDISGSNFANGRYVRNYIEKLMLIQCDRAEDKQITIEDIELYILEQPKKEEKRLIGFCYC